MPRVLATQEAEIRRIEASPGKQFHETLSQKTLHKNRAVGVAQSEGPKFQKSPSTKKQKKNLPSGAKIC
jgi:hypothetical protein